MELKKCPNCEKSVLAIAKVCKHCCYSFETQQVPPIKHTQVNVEADYSDDYKKNKTSQTISAVERPAYRQDSDYKRKTEIAKKDELGCLFGGICFIIPIAGLIMWIIYRESSPKKAINALYCGIAGFAFYYLPSLIVGLLN
jgi:hypothetical protein